MSPTSLANHRLSIKPDKNLLPPRRPPHQKLLRELARRTPRQAVVVLLAALLLLWRWLGSSNGPTLTFSSLEDSPRPTPSLQFAPSQVTHPSARVRYREGSAQIIDLQDTPQKLWGDAVVSVEIPLGGTLTLLGDEGQADRREELQMGADCTGNVCEGVKRATLQQDLRVGLRQLREADHNRELVLTVPTLYSWSPTGDITLVTQFSISRLSRFERTLAAWDGPMSIAIYLTDHEDIHVLEEHLSVPENRRRWKKVAVAVVKPSYAPESLVGRLRYPINRLRNLALALAPTRFTLVIDADFLPSPHMHSHLQNHALPLFGATDSSNLHRTAVIISAFALSSSYPITQPYPSTLSSLSAAIRSGQATLTDRNAGHGPSLPSLFLASPHSSHFSTLEICYEPQYEPYYLLHTPSHLLYDERFTDQGGDKQSHALTLNALGYRFFGLRGAWVMHPPKSSPSSTPSREELVGSDGTRFRRLEEEIDESWPSARLAEAEELDSAHFNAHAQRDEQRYRYFQDFLPEVEKLFGWNVRFPRGCGAGQVASGRMFGRARANSAFGL